MAKTTIYGIHAVESALRNDPENIGTIWLEKNTRNDRLKKLQAQIAEVGGLKTTPADMEQLNKLSSTGRHQGVVAEYYKAKDYTENDLYDLLDELDNNGIQPFLLVLDGVTDPHNLGACLRTADGAGVHAVIAPKDNAASINPTVRKVASGAAEAVPFIAVTNLARTLDSLKERGIWLTGTSDKAKQTLYQADLKGSMALVMGAEGTGIRRLTEERCDFLISIPMCGQVSSLNVSVATGVCLYEALRQRQN
ncbi:23S rRNA (guanosine(2251)-2'-O)-methyltransferase RlmB [uncultured Thiothrix sp.]|uniref:23S rRNA (guanosine(2251)-2'-O)-methyltransferase RlmB n=1 Tax=uncultured Thiothrix sp. TaxID=223185 RepID=UPI002613F550|nr:23S rRNA (guanosine(2251)-2'-O)-methyltransferase RlmB [uncultured Thiothrix sp.]HMT94611.1 23S rRNA (guanosine(2251)-2'-O)-methyltransferase RlmB [Thiolinea sp.]